MNKILKLCFYIASVNLTLLSLASFNFASAESGNSHIFMDSPHSGDSGWDISLGPGIFATDQYFIVGMEDEEKIGPILLTDIYYQNNNFYFFVATTDGIAAGYSIYKKDNWVIDIVGSPKFAIPSNDLLDTIDERELDFHTGLKFYHYGEDNLFAIEISQDISGIHNGALLSVEYLHEFQLRNWVLTLGVAAAYLSADMTDYYFGVDADEANVNFSAYEAGSSTALFGQIKLEYPISEKWIFTGYLLTTKGDSTIEDSPLTRSDSVNALITGVRYRF